MYVSDTYMYVSETYMYVSDTYTRALLSWTARYRPMDKLTFSRVLFRVSCIYIEYVKKDLCETD